MVPMIVKIILCILIPMLLLCGLLETRSRYIVLSMCVGCLSCLAAYYLNTWIRQLLDCSNFYLTTSVSPFIEETAKFLPICLFACFVSKEKHLLLSCAFAAGMGFAIIENSFMLSQAGSDAAVSWLLVRGIGTGLMHGMSTLIVGTGIYYAFRDPRLLLLRSSSSLFLAMMYHGAYNAVVQTEVIKYFGIFVPLLSYAAVYAALNKENIRKFLEA